jgi:hypothetical protein
MDRCWVKYSENVKFVRKKWKKNWKNGNLGKQSGNLGLLNRPYKEEYKGKKITEGPCLVRKSGKLALGISPVLFQHRIRKWVFLGYFG